MKIDNPSRGSAFNLDYEPDACMIKKRNNKLIIFEVLDTQSDVKTIADIIRCLFIRYCERLIFITKDENHQQQIKKVVDTIISNLKLWLGDKGRNMMSIDVIIKPELEKALEKLLSTNKNKCDYCGKRFSKSNSCKLTRVKIGGKIFDRGSNYFDSNTMCHDCGILNKKGNVHHFGCDMERCPNCKDQFAFCSCKFKKLLP